MTEYFYNETHSKILFANKGRECTKIALTLPLSIYLKPFKQADLILKWLWLYLLRRRSSSDEEGGIRETILFSFYPKMFHLYPSTSRNTILLANPPSLYFSCSCCRLTGSPESKRRSSLRVQNGPETEAGFKRRSRAAEKSPLVFNSALVTVAKSYDKNSWEFRN